MSQSAVPVKPSRGLERFLVVVIVLCVVWLFAFQMGLVTDQQLSIKPVSERKPLGNMSMPLLNGGTWNSNSERGKVLLVNYWATWCPPCRHELPDLEALYNKYRSKGFQVVGIEMGGEPKSQVQSFVLNSGITYPVAYPSNVQALVSVAPALPTSVVTDRQGRVVMSFTGAVNRAEFEPVLHKLLDEPGG